MGVAGHSRQSDLASSEMGISYYSTYQQPLGFGTLVVRSAGNPESLAAVIRQAVNAIDPAQPIYDVKTMEERVSESLADRRFTIALLALFALAAISLAALGLYGVINYSVTQRTQEVGIRIVLGAQRTAVLALIMTTGIRMALAGLAAGALVAFAIAQTFSSQLFGVGAFDPLTFLSMALLMTMVALLASYLPARRAMRLDPLAACRYE